jgi:hypothetical protein
LFEFVIHDHVSHYLKFKISLYQHGFSKINPPSPILVTYVDFIPSLVGSQRQVNAIHFVLNNTFDLLQNAMILLKVGVFGLSGGCLNWFCSYLSNRKS